MFRALVIARAVEKRLDRIRDLAPAAVMRALNTSAFEVRQGWVEEVKKEFDRPTPLTQRSPLYKSARLDNLVAEVFIRDKAARGTAPAQYLGPQARGGPRQQKASERALAHMGFPRYWVPGPGAPIDPFGNVPASFVRLVLNSLMDRASPARKGAKRRRGLRARGKARDFFIPASGAGGRLKSSTVYERLDSGGVVPVFIGVRAAPRYRVRFDAVKVATRIFDARYKVNLRREWMRARIA